MRTIRWKKQGKSGSTEECKQRETTFGGSVEKSRLAELTLKPTECILHERLEWCDLFLATISILSNNLFKGVGVPTGQAKIASARNVQPQTNWNAGLKWEINHF